MATTKKAKRTPAPAKSTIINPQAAWPFPTTDRASMEAAEERNDDSTEPAAAERVEVASLRLYTDPAKNQVERIALEQLEESPFNPRTRYDEKALQELADTVRGVGVMEPILVRPSPGMAAHNTPIYEIIFGHRRTRAAKIAGEVDVPAIVRDLTDAQAAQLQAIENVQRKDLDPIEEARGYAHYLKVHGVTKDQLAAEIGLSRSHVYSRLKLATAIPAVLDAVQSGEIYEENALRIARLPSAKLQEKALASIRSNHLELEDGGKRSVRRIQDFLRERFTLKLSGAIFDSKDPLLLPLAGACTVCSKRAGNAPEFADLADDTTKEYYSKHLRAGPDLCTDPECFDSKKKAHLRAAAEKLRGQGKVVVDGGKARSAISAEGQVKGSYIDLAEVKKMLAGSKKKDLPKASELAVVTIQNPRDGKTKQAVHLNDLPEAIKPKAKPAGSGSASDRRRDEAALEKQRQEAELEKRVNRALLTQVRQALAGRPLPELALRLVTARVVDSVAWEDRELLAELHQFKNPREVETMVDTLPIDRVATLLLDCLLVDGIEPYFVGEKPDALLALANEAGIDVKAIRKEVATAAVDTRTQDLPLSDAGVEVDEEAQEAA